MAILFPSSVFLLFFLPIVLLLYYGTCGGKINRQNFVLLVSSLFFYSWGEPMFLSAMLGCILVNWFYGRIFTTVGPKWRRTLFVLTILFDLSVLLVFKYANFLTDAWNQLGLVQIALPRIRLPIGISFFTFQALSYTIDVYRRRVAPQTRLSYLTLYIAFFPQLIAGPIVRYETIALELESRSFCMRDFSDGVGRFVIGLGKKAIIANSIVSVADFAFSQNPQALSVSAAWLGAAAYALQIYFDFSGYSDMAIGLGKMFGFHFPENFSYPYCAKSISDFWRRWHISLSTWFRDYVYFPMGGSRVSRMRLVRNLFVVWFLTGLWHGANWTYVLWGVYFFVLLAFEKLTGFGKRMEKTRIIGHIYAIIAICIGWILFRSENIRQAFGYFTAVFAGYGNPLFRADAVFLLQEFWPIWMVGILSCIPFRGVVYKSINQTQTGLWIKWVCIGLVFALSIIHISGNINNPFIYFAF